MIEVLKQLVDALENHSAIKHPQQIHYRDAAIEAGKQLIAELESQEPVAFASIKIRVGNQQVEKLLTQIELHHAIDPWGLVEQAAEMCIEELKEMDT